ncbi:MAG TPA: rhodanese-like domain-containing protein [Gammaproteobacteria bacterium]
MQIINRKELERMLERRREFVLIDALPEDDFEHLHLPFAINVPLNDERFEDRIREAVPEPEYDIVVYCSNAECPVSREAARRIESLGYVSVYQYRDGKEGWFHGVGEMAH